MACPRYRVKCWLPLCKSNVFLGHMFKMLRFSGRLIILQMFPTPRTVQNLFFTYQGAKMSTRKMHPNHLWVFHQVSYKSSIWPRVRGPEVQWVGWKVFDHWSKHLYLGYLSQAKLWANPFLLLSPPPAFQNPWGAGAMSIDWLWFVGLCGNLAHWVLTWLDAVWGCCRGKTCCLARLFLSPLSLFLSLFTMPLFAQWHPESQHMAMERGSAK